MRSWGGRRPRDCWPRCVGRRPGSWRRRTSRAAGRAAGAAPGAAAACPAAGMARKRRPSAVTLGRPLGPLDRRCRLRAACGPIQSCGGRCPRLGLCARGLTGVLCAGARRARKRRTVTSAGGGRGRPGAARCGTLRYAIIHPFARPPGQDVSSGAEAHLRRSTPRSPRCRALPGRQPRLRDAVQRLDAAPSVYPRVVSAFPLRVRGRPADYARE